MVVLCNGVFDILHIGHIRHLRAAREMGDYLVVSVTRDRSVNKGPDRPYMRDKARAELLRHYRFVDRVILVDSSLEALKKIRPQIFCKGADYRYKLLVEDFEFCDKHGIKVKFTGKPIDSSTRYHDLIRPR